MVRTGKYEFKNSMIKKLRSSRIMYQYEESLKKYLLFNKKKKIGCIQIN